MAEIKIDIWQMARAVVEHLEENGYLKKGLDLDELELEVDGVLDDNFDAEVI